MRFKQKYINIFHKFYYEFILKCLKIVRDHQCSFLFSLTQNNFLHSICMTEFGDWFLCQILIESISQQIEKEGKTQFYLRKWTPEALDFQEKETGEKSSSWRFVFGQYLENYQVQYSATTFLSKQ